MDAKTDIINEPIEEITNVVHDDEDDLFSGMDMDIALDDINESIFEPPEKTTFTDEEYQKMAKMAIDMGFAGKNIIEKMKKFNTQRFSNVEKKTDSVDL